MLIHRAFRVAATVAVAAGLALVGGVFGAASTAAAATKPSSTPPDVPQIESVVASQTLQYSNDDLALLSR